MGLICGIDEAGRGPLAGPVTAAAVILPPDFPFSILADSKKLSEKQRNAILPIILEKASAYGLGWVWHFEIDRINIHRASLLAMERAFLDLPVRPFRALADGKFYPRLPVPGEAVVGGDGLIPEIMAASILAKTARDRWMVRHSWLEPGYDFEKHKGYPTLGHRNLCITLGPSSIQRMSFSITVPTKSKTEDLFGTF